MRDVPKYVRPTPEPYPEVEVALNVLGINPARAAVLHALVKNETMTAVEVQAETGIPRHTAIRHLVALEAAGAVTADAPEGAPRNGRSVRFTLCPNTLVAAVEHLERYVDPRRSETRPPKP